MSNTGANDVKKLYELNSDYVKVGDKNVWVEFTGLARYTIRNLIKFYPFQTKNLLLYSI
jgi:hypothetical protein